jgi:hypothetical protein
MKPQEQIAQLEKEKAALEQQVIGLKRRVEELESAKPKSKSRQQAEQGLEMLKEGPVPMARFATLNQKYPGDVAYYIRNIFKQQVHTVRTKSGSVYMLPEHFAVYQAGLEKEKQQEKAAAEEAKEEVSPAPKASSGSQASAAA